MGSTVPYKEDEEEDEGEGAEQGYELEIVRDYLKDKDLPEDKRKFCEAWIETDGKKTEMKKTLGCSRTEVYNRLKEAKEAILSRIKKTP